jgi:ABC-type sugar transport system substrate-binding protein
MVDSQRYFPLAMLGERRYVNHLQKALMTLILAAGLGALFNLPNQSRSANYRLEVTLPCSNANPSWSRIVAGAEAAGQKFGIQVNIKRSAIGSAANPLALACLPRTVEAIVDSIQNCQPVQQESRENHSQSPSAVASMTRSVCKVQVNVNERLAGRRAADAVMQSRSADVNVMLIHTRGENTVNNERVSGFREELTVLNETRGSSGPSMECRIVERTFELTNGSDDLVASLLAANRDSQWIVLLDDCSALLLGRLIEVSRVTPRPKVIVFGVTRDVVAAINAGAVYATIGGDPFDMGYMAVAWANSLHRPAKTRLFTIDLQALNLPLHVIRQADTHLCKWAL